MQHWLSKLVPIEAFHARGRPASTRFRHENGRPAPSTDRRPTGLRLESNGSPCVRSHSETHTVRGMIDGRGAAWYSVSMKIDFLYYEDCPSHEQTLARLKQVMAEEGVDAPIAIHKMETEAQARAWHFVGSPTILIDGQDIDPPPPDAPAALTCRVYRWDDGRISPLPSPEMIRRALRKAMVRK